MKTADHVRMGPGLEFFCEFCGDAQPMPSPVGFDVLMAAGKAYLRNHRACKKPKARIAELGVSRES
jgi:hypothetical protein